ncbi:CGNR zinc finger domain-containing protein [Actinoplanes sp. NBRC 103695]|uniref:CGNR zinc finger domain-containing protein n=1 Tax=Actinoplanes sp. NBRC 103695 TaxID=3032202 RepID=UPI0025525D09|nr:CGNR zinc finger domain-containing protein [Actinoplanes sp. NBRC 103695]
MALLNLDAGGERLGLCAHRPCRRVFADTTRGGRQSCCSPRCANTEAVRRHRNRHMIRPTIVANRCSLRIRSRTERRDI